MTFIVWSQQIIASAGLHTPRGVVQTHPAPARSVHTTQDQLVHEEYPLGLVSA